MYLMSDFEMRDILLPIYSDIVAVEMRYGCWSRRRRSRKRSRAERLAASKNEELFAQSEDVASVAYLTLPRPMNFRGGRG